jgi:hypothetical protein
MVTALSRPHGPESCEGSTGEEQGAGSPGDGQEASPVEITWMREEPCTSAQGPALQNPPTMEEVEEVEMEDTENGIEEIPADTSVVIKFIGDQETATISNLGNKSVAVKKERVGSRQEDDLQGPEVPYRCGVCGAGHDGQKQFLTHLASVHYWDRLHRDYDHCGLACPEPDCSKTYSRQRALLHHIAEGHGKVLDYYKVSYYYEVRTLMVKFNFLWVVKLFSGRK